MDGCLITVIQFQRDGDVVILGTAMRRLGLLIGCGLSVFFAMNAIAEEGDQVINGTQVHTVIDRSRGVATFSNSCGSQTLTQGQLQNGAIPNNIIPCPRPQSGTQRQNTNQRPGATYEELLRQRNEILNGIDNGYRNSCLNHIEQAQKYLDSRAWQVGPPHSADRCDKNLDLRPEAYRLANKICDVMAEEILSSGRNIVYDQVSATYFHCEDVGVDPDNKWRVAVKAMFSGMQSFQPRCPPAADVVGRIRGEFACIGSSDAVEIFDNDARAKKCAILEAQRQNEAVSCWGALAESTAARNDQGLIDYASERAYTLARTGPQGESAQVTQRIAPGCNADFPIRRTGPACVGVPSAISVGELTACCVAARDLRQQLKDKMQGR